MRLYRPVGLAEMKLIFGSGLTAFPPRLPEQPIFYPVLSRSYARQIAREWNAGAEPFAGYVTEFEVADEFASRYPVQRVGTADHTELWVPSADLHDFNVTITPPIRVVDAYFGEEFEGFVPSCGLLKGKNARDQFAVLAAALDYNGMDFACEIAANSTAVFLHFPFWGRSDLTWPNVDEARKTRVLDAIRARWLRGQPCTPLPIAGG